MASLRTFIRSYFKKPQLRMSYEQVIGEVKKYFPNAPVHSFSDEEVESVNSTLNWNAFTTDANGRQIGRAHSRRKRAIVQTIPDYRIVNLNKSVDLSKKSVLEIGCFEGIHSIGLAAFSASVKAIDSRIENIIKASARAYLYGIKNVDFQVVDIEATPVNLLGQFDVVFHCGVLYHLRDPLKHLDEVGVASKEAFFLDTHVSSAGDDLVDYTHKGRCYKVKKFRESGYADVFSGMHNYSYWLSEKDLTGYLKDTLNFKIVEVLERRDERAGLRLAILARR